MNSINKTVKSAYEYNTHVQAPSDSAHTSHKFEKIFNKYVVA